MMRFVEGNRVELLQTGDEYFPALIADVDAAREEVHLETYIFEDDLTGRRVADALARAARRGVTVRLLVDGFGASNLVRPLREILEPPGVSIQVFRPERGRFRLRRSRMRRMHRKLAVIDRRIAYCGGINVLDDRDGRGEGAPRFDFAVRLQGPVVAEVHEAVRRLWLLVAWTRAGRRPGPRMEPCAPQPFFPDGHRVAFLVRDNFRNRRAIEEAYLEAIDRAKREILIANAYFLPGLRFRRALFDAVARGVKVRLLLQGRREYFWVHYAIRASYAGLLRAGIEIHEYLESWHHAKVAVVDGRWATVGSSNIDPLSLLMAREANVVTSDPDIGARLQVLLERAVLEGSAEVHAAALARWSWLDRLLAWVGERLGRLVSTVAGAETDR
jgi:cardiolipin synthase